MKYIELTQNKKAIVDDEDYERVSRYNWCTMKLKNHYYCYYRAVRGGPKVNGKRKLIYMSRFILGIMDSKKVIDHINCNTLDNRKVNLRICTSRENSYNQRGTNGNLYKGVTFYKKSKKWRARLQVNSKEVCLGYYTNPKLAYEAYCKAAKKYHGKFAHF